MATEATNNSLRRGLVDIRVPNDIYPSFVSNYRSDLIIGPSNINKVDIEDANKGINSSSSTFTTHLQAELLYSNLAILTSDVSFEFNNVRVKQDRVMLATSIKNGAQFEDLTANPILAPNDNTIDWTKEVSYADYNKCTTLQVYRNGFTQVYNYTGLSTNPFQVEWAPCPNFLNAYLGANSSLSLAINGMAVQMQTTPKLHDLFCRSLKEEDTQNNWNGALIPMKSVVRGQRYHAFKKSCPFFTHDGSFAFSEDIVDKEQNDGSNIKVTVIRGLAVEYPTRFPTYEDIERDPNAATNSSNRGQLDRGLEVEWTFTKKLPSFNYKIMAEKIGTAYSLKLVKMEKETTDLRTMYVNGYAFPSHIEKHLDYSDEDVYLMFGDMAFFHFDQLSPIAKRITAKTSAGGEPAKDLMVFFENEPLNQSMNVKKTYKQMTVPVFNPLLSMEKSTYSWSNTNYFKLMLQRNANHDTLFEYMGAVNIVNKSIRDNQVGINIDCANTTVSLTQYAVASMESAIKRTSELYFNTYLLASEKNTRVPIPDPKISKTSTITIQHSDISIGSDMPSRMFIFLDRGANASGEVLGYRITKISASISNGIGGNALDSRTQEEYYRLTKKVAFVNYKQSDYLGYSVPYKTFTNRAGLGSGTILCFEMSDFGFSNQVLSVAGLSGKNVTIKYIITAEIDTTGIPEKALYEVRSNVFHVTNSKLELTNSNATIKNSLFEQSHVAEAIQQFKDSANEGNLHMSNRRFLGGSVISSLLKARHILPKVWDSAKSITGTASNILNTMNSGIAKVDKYKHFFNI